MRERNGARGPFLGCVAYPRCRGTRQVSKAASGSSDTANEAVSEARDAEQANAAQGWAARQAAKSAAAAKGTATGTAPGADPTDGTYESVLRCERGRSGGIRRVSASSDLQAMPEEAAPGPGYDATAPEEDAPY